MSQPRPKFEHVHVTLSTHSRIPGHEEILGIAASLMIQPCTVSDRLVQSVRQALLRRVVLYEHVVIGLIALRVNGGIR